MSGPVIIHDDCTVAMRELPAGSIDACVTDPPYHLTNNTGTRSPYPGQYTPIGKPKQPKGGFMGKQWDGGDVAFQPETWRLVWEVLKPGAHLLAFSGTRTYHRMACAIEDAGFEIRDQIGWLYGSGFPKSHNAGNGWGTALKPAWEPIVLARKPLIGTVAANVLKHGTGALNIDGCRVATEREVPASLSKCKTPNGVFGEYGGGHPKELDPNLGRWPANVIHDGSDEVVEAFPDSQDGVAGKRTGQNGVGNWGYAAQGREWGGYGGHGSAARFFYSAKADSDDRLGSKHPTVKPVDLIAYLCRLITPPGGTVLDCFAGSGTTGMACMREGFNAILIEREAEYVEDIKRRIAHVQGLDTPMFAEVAAQ